MKAYCITSEVHKWIEDFVDEDTNEVVSIERTTILEYKVEDFEVIPNANKEQQAITAKYNVELFNNSLKKYENPREFIKIISAKTYNRLKGLNPKAQFSAIRKLIK